MDESKKKIINRRKHYKNERLKRLDIYRKNDRLSCRISSVEKRAISDIADSLGMDISEYIINAALNNQILKIDLSSLDEFSRQLSSLGNQLNQITRVLNEARYNETLNDSTIEEAIKEMDRLYNEYEEDLKIARKYHLELSRIRREVLTNAFEPFDYIEEEDLS